MKYTPPTGLPYESGLTAEVMYESTRSILISHANGQLYAGLRSNILPKSKIWDTQPIRGELEELVTSYLFGNLTGGLRDLGENMKIEGGVHKLSDSYVGGLFARYRDIEGLRREVQKGFATVTERANLMSGELAKIKNLDKPKLMRETAIDAFSNLVNIYGEIQTDLKGLTLI